MDFLHPSVAAILGAVIGVVGSVVVATINHRTALKLSREQADRAAPRCTAITLYAKVVEWGLEGEGVDAAYTVDASRSDRSPIEAPVFDETVYTALAVYDKPTDAHEYIFRGSGVVDMLCLHPWRGKLRFSDAGAERDPHQVRQAFADQASNAYVVVTHAYNGLQVGNEDFGVRMPLDAAEGRLVVDLSSVPHILDAMTERPRAELRSNTAEAMEISVTSYRRGIFVIEGKDLRKDDVLFLDLSIDWDRLWDHTVRISSATDRSSKSSPAGGPSRTPRRSSRPA
ncbi:MAG: hypothetical protein AAGB00_12300 [Planctomycetota bacterium]